MLKELIHNKINEVFAEYQEINGITSGDINPLDALHLASIEQQLGDLIEKVIAYQQTEIPASFYIYRDGNDVTHSVTYEHIDTDKFFYEVSKRYAFDDCTNETMVAIFWRGKEVEYMGWKPNMTFEYKDLNGKTVWVGSFPEWDH